MPRFARSVIVRVVTPSKSARAAVVTSLMIRRRIDRSEAAKGGGLTVLGVTKFLGLLFQKAGGIN